MNPYLLLLAAGATSALGALGGLGGAILLVPLLVLSGLSVAAAAPLGLISVAALSIAAAPTHLRARVVNHRLGLTTEVAASGGAVLGAMVSGVLDERFLVYLLAATALVAAVAGGRRKGLRNRPDPDLGFDAVGEHVGRLSGVYPLGTQVVPYQTRRLPQGLAFMALSGLMAGTAGVSGGFIKTPATTELMHVPTKVAAATTTFTIGVTAAAALTVFEIQGRIDLRAGAAVIVGSWIGSSAGATAQDKLDPAHVRKGLSVLLAIVAAVLVSTA